MNKTVLIEPNLANAAPNYVMLYMEADVANCPTPDALRMELEKVEADLKESLPLNLIKEIPGVASIRAAYKALGKDPNRYRPAQEQLMRRVVRGLGLYFIDAVVDAGNLVSILSGCPIGVFDRDKIQGDTLRLGVGREQEPYEGIGRGTLNVAGLPIVRDEAGGIGTPTSDNERTKVDASTKRLSICLHIFDATDIDISSIQALLIRAFTTYAAATNIELCCCRVH